VSDDLNSFEAVLRGFRPHPPSPAWRGRIAQQLARPTPVTRSLRPRVALAGGLIAAGVALLAVLQVTGPAKRDGHIAERSTLKRPITPTVRAYRQALAQSPASLDALLDEQAVQSAQTAGRSQPVTAFAPVNRTYLSWRGDR